MEILLEIVGQLALEGCWAVGSNKKISKLVRYPLLTLVLLFYLAVAGILLTVTVVSLLERNILAFLVMLALDGGLLALTVLAARKQLEKKKA